MDVHSRIRQPRCGPIHGIINEEDEDELTGEGWWCEEKEEGWGVQKEEEEEERERVEEDLRRVPEWRHL